MDSYQRWTSEIPLAATQFVCWLLQTQPLMAKLSTQLGPTKNRQKRKEGRKHPPIHFYLLILQGPFWFSFTVYPQLLGLLNNKSRKEEKSYNHFCPGYWFCFRINHIYLLKVKNKFWVTQPPIPVVLCKENLQQRTEVLSSLQSDGRSLE